PLRRTQPTPCESDLFRISERSRPMYVNTHGTPVRPQRTSFNDLPRTSSTMQMSSWAKTGRRHGHLIRSYAECQPTSCTIAFAPIDTGLPRRPAGSMLSGRTHAVIDSALWLPTSPVFHGPGSQASWLGLFAMTSWMNTLRNC